MNFSLYLLKAFTLINNSMKTLEERRFKLALSGNVMTDYVVKNGMGNIDNSRFEKAINQLSETYNYKTKPNAKLYFTDMYLPMGGFKLK